MRGYNPLGEQPRQRRSREQMIAERLRNVYDNRLDSAEGCLDLMEKLFMEQGASFLDTRIFLGLDELFAERRGVDIDKIDLALQRRYLSLFSKVSSVVPERTSTEEPWHRGQIRGDLTPYHKGRVAHGLAPAVRKLLVFGDTRMAVYDDGVTLTKNETKR